VEGVCGLVLAPAAPSVNPLIPPRWKWVALRRVPYHGRELTYFVGRHGEGFHVYANADVQSTHHREIYAEDVSTSVHGFCATAEVVALRRPGELMVLVGNVGTQTSIVPLDLHEVVDANTQYDLRIYNSERRAWEPGHRESGTIVAALALGIEVNGFRAIELKQVIP
jgi:hypothetical protein